MIDTSMVSQVPKETNQGALSVLESGQDVGVIEFANGTFALVPYNLGGLSQFLSGITGGAAGTPVRKLETHERDQMIAAIKDALGQTQTPQQGAAETVGVGDTDLDAKVEAAVRKAFAKIFG